MNSAQSKVFNEFLQKQKNLNESILKELASLKERVKKLEGGIE